MPYCRKCGYAAGAGETDCRVCGQGLQPGHANARLPKPANMAGANAPAPRTRIAQRLLMVGVPAAALALGGFAFGAYWFHTIPTFEQLVPNDTAGVAVVDAHWWWDASSDVRAQPEIRDAIRDMEKETKLSLQNDIVPWVGEIGVAGFNTSGKKMPTAVAYLQVRDWPAFLRFANDMKQRASDSSGNRWEESTYHGVKIETLEASKDDTPFSIVPSVSLSAMTDSVSIAYIKGWVVLGVGKVGLERAIDTYQGQKKSIAEDSTWAKALALRPEHWFAWAGVASKEFASALKPVVPYATGDVPGMLGVPESVTGVLSTGNDDSLEEAKPTPAELLDKVGSYDFVGIGVASDRGSGLRFDAYGVAGSDQVKQLWRDVKGTSGGVSGDILAQLPKDSAMAFMAHDPAGWWNRYKKAILTAVPARSRRAVESSLREIGPAEEAVQNFPGDCGIALTYHQGMGFGAVLLAQGSNPQAVDDSSHKLGDFLTQENVKVSWDGDRAILPELASSEHQSVFPFEPVFGKHDTYFTAATSPIWLDASVERGAGLAMPEEARGADALALGDFRMLTSLLNDATKDDDIDARTQQAIRDLGLESAHWDAFTKMAPDGSIQQSTWEINDWNWREAIRRELADSRDSK